jgi:hypothetical protein
MQTLTDSIISMEVVLADGSQVTVSSTSNPDLFWALRGGNSGSFGIVTSFLVNIYPVTTMVTPFQISFTHDVNAVDAWQRKFTRLNADAPAALNSQINIDGNALYRQSAIAAMNDPSQEDEREAQAAEYNLNYVALEGNIGCMVNGAGLAMGTMDLVKLHGGNPANFLDVGGGATKEAVSEAFKIILSDQAVQAVLINIFGGIVSCATIAEGIIGAVQEVGVEVPVVVRFEGNNSELGRKTLADSGLNIIPADSLVDAAEKAVAAAGGKS